MKKIFIYCMLTLDATAMPCSAFKLTSTDFKDGGQLPVFCSFACSKPEQRFSSATTGLYKRKQLKTRRAMEHISDPIAYARDVVGGDPMATFLGVHIDEVRPGYARCSLLVKPEYLNAADRAHGVTVCAVADQAFAVACNSLGTKALAVSLKLTYTAAAPSGDIIVAEATPVNVGRKVSVWKIEVRGRENALIASCEGIAYHK